jgi:hypothetical protein
MFNFVWNRILHEWGFFWILNLVCIRVKTMCVDLFPSCQSFVNFGLFYFSKVLNMLIWNWLLLTGLGYCILRRFKRTVIIITSKIRQWNSCSHTSTFRHLNLTILLCVGHIFITFIKPIVRFLCVCINNIRW